VEVAAAETEVVRRPQQETKVAQKLDPESARVVIGFVCCIGPKPISKFEFCH
jgi:hypothetical protein